MTTRSVATVFGGSGFLGRYVVRRLAAQGHVVRVAVRRTAPAAAMRPLGQVGQIVPLHASLGDQATVARAVEGASVVVNLVGILAESRKGDFDRLHAEGAERIARTAANAGVAQLVQVSAIGADPDSPSAYGRSKAAGEAAVRAAFPSATILRPSLVFGPEDDFFNRFGGIARLAPVMPVFCGDTRMQPVYVGDVADAVHRVLTTPDAAGGLFELGGPRVWKFREIIRFILEQTHRRRRMVDVPMGLARLQASFLEHVPGKPLTRDQLAMLGRDNVVADGAAGLEALGIAPTPLELVVPAYLARYRPGGGKREIPE
ncbi:complex I NDUFA9 subunit family protein [Rhizosaccharibacter radicis]|uniref:Complex I NDUFA9 subunit family protein n=1 Tax=Rhizosaccharibacter radicis TaxID=2782605 RepID=A0ABT1VVD8_9PROT|nr:complex I NDUFA9 subunit family protein [Acetobacteraceae bacterium KSS12]